MQHTVAPHNTPLHEANGNTHDKTKVKDKKTRSQNRHSARQ